MSKELDHSGAGVIGLLQAVVEFVEKAPGARAPDDWATNRIAELERLEQSRCEAERLADFERLRVEQEQQRMQRMYKESMEAERLAELDWRVVRERLEFEGETAELEPQRVLERLDAAMARSQRARDVEHERQDEESALWRQRTQETLKTIRDEALRVEADGIARGY